VKKPLHTKKWCY